MKYSDNDFVFRRCTSDCISSICEIQEIAFSMLDNPDILRRNSKEQLSECLEDPHYTIGAFHNDKLAAFAVLYDSISKENIGYDIGLNDDQIKFSANIKLVIVLPEYRGNGLQKKLISRLERIAKDRGKKILCATVSPNNIFSTKNFEHLGYQLHSCKFKYGGLKRNIYYKNI